MSDTEEELRNAVRTMAEARVAEALGGDVLGRIVDSVMKHRDTRYRRSDKTMLESLIEENVISMVAEVVQEHLRDRKDEIRAAIAKSLAERADPFAVAIMDGFVNQDWRADLQVKIMRPEEYDR